MRKHDPNYGFIEGVKLDKPMLTKEECARIDEARTKVKDAPKLVSTPKFQRASHELKQAMMKAAHERKIRYIRELRNSDPEEN